MAAAGELVVAGVEQGPPMPLAVAGAQHVEQVQLAADVAAAARQPAAGEADDPLLPFGDERPAAVGEGLRAIAARAPRRSAGPDSRRA